MKTKRISLKQIASVRSTKVSGRKFMAGDFNIALNDRPVRFPPDQALNKSKVVNNLTTDYGL